MRCGLDVHGIRVEIESDSAEALAGVRGDFRFFESTPGEANAAPHVRARLVVEPPVLPAAPAPRLLFRTGGNTVYVSRGIRYVADRSASALTRFDARADAAVISAGSPAALRSAAYIFLLSRIGSRLDRRRRHRAHALGVAIGGRAVLFIAGTGVGKTTLGLSLLGRGRNASWLADEIPIVDRDLVVRPFPLPPRLVEGSPIPWPPPPVPFSPVVRTKLPRKVQIDLGAILPRVARPAPLAAVFACRRRNGAARTTVRRASLLAALPRLLPFVVLGHDFPHTKAFWLDLSPRGLVSEAGVLASRAALAAKILARVPVFAVDFSDDPEEGAAAVAAALDARLGLALEPAIPRRAASDGGRERILDYDHDEFLGRKGERPCSGPTNATGIS